MVEALQQCTCTWVLQLGKHASASRGGSAGVSRQMWQAAGGAVGVVSANGSGDVGRP